MPRAEEYYNNQNPYILDLLRHQGQVQREQSRYGAEDIANTRREIGHTIGNAISEAPKRYQEGKKSAQDYRKGEIEAEESQTRSKSMAARMQDEQREREWLDSVDPKSGKTRRETAYQQRMDTQDLQNKQITANIADANRRTNMDVERFGWDKKNQQVADAAALFGKAYTQTPQQDPRAQGMARQAGLSQETIDQQSSWNQAQQKQMALENVRQDLRNRGYSEDVIAKAEAAYLRGAKDTSASDYVVYSNQNPNLQPKVMQAHSDVDSLAELQDALKSYQNSQRGTETNKQAKNSAVTAARKLGIEDVSDIESDSTVFRQQSINIILTKAKNDVRTKINLLKAEAGPSAPPAVQNQIMTLESKYQQIESMINQKVNFMDGTPVGSAKSAIMNAIFGGGQQYNAPPPQQGGMQNVGGQGPQGQGGHQSRFYDSRSR